MNLKSVAMATGLVLTFAAGAWLSTIMLGAPQRANRVAVQEHAPSPVTPVPAAPASEPAVSGSILPPLPPLPPAPVETPPAQASIAEAPPVEPPPVEPPLVDQSAQPPEPAPEQPPEPPPTPVAEAVLEVPPPAPVPPPTPESPAIALAPSEPGIDPGIAALSDLVARPPSAVPSAPSIPTVVRHPAISPDPALPLPPTLPARPPAPQDAGRYFTIQVGSFQDPANAASLVRSLETKGWEVFVVDWTNSTGQVWKVVRVGRYQTEAQANGASAELLSAAKLRGNVIRVR